MAANLTYRCEELQLGILLVSLGAELNEASWTDIEEVGSDIADRVRSRDRPRVLVDLSPLEHMGSALVALVVRIWKAVTERDGEMVVVNDNQLVDEVLEIAGLKAKWTIVSTREAGIEELEEALGSLAGGGRGSQRGLPWLAAGVAALLLGILGAADAIGGGNVASAAGRIPLLGVAAGFALAALLLAGVAARMSVGAIQMASVVVATLSVVLLIGSGLLIVNRNAWGPGAEDRPVNVSIGGWELGFGGAGHRVSHWYEFG